MEIKKKDDTTERFNDVSLERALKGFQDLLNPDSDVESVKFFRTLIPEQPKE